MAGYGEQGGQRFDFDAMRLRPEKKPDQGTTVPTDPIAELRQGLGGDAEAVKDAYTRARGLAEHLVAVITGSRLDAAAHDTEKIVDGFTLGILGLDPDLADLFNQNTDG